MLSGCALTCLPSHRIQGTCGASGRGVCRSLCTKMGMQMLTSTRRRSGRGTRVISLCILLYLGRNYISSTSAGPRSSPSIRACHDLDFSGGSAPLSHLHHLCLWIGFDYLLFYRVRGCCVSVFNGCIILSGVHRCSLFRFTRWSKDGKGWAKAEKERHGVRPTIRCMVTYMYVHVWIVP